MIKVQKKRFVVLNWASSPLDSTPRHFEKLHRF
jgi:hypothetical protein